MSRKKTVQKCMRWLLILVMLTEAIPIPAAAGLLVQTEGRVTQVLYHEHGDEQSGCYERTFKPCGGTFVQLADNSKYYCCTKCFIYTYGKPASLTHEGTYTSELVCDVSELGTFFIERAGDADGVFLTAGIDGRSELIDAYEISWNEDGAYSGTDTSVMPVTKPATYRATLRYHDRNRDEWSETSLEYTDLTVPCRIRYYSEGALLYEDELLYGSSFGTVSVPERRGYDFKGYHSGAGRFYDAEGEPADQGLQPIVTPVLELTAEWSAKQFPFRYGADTDGDGLGDSEAVLTYDQAPPSISLSEPAERPGFEFTGYYIGDQLLYDTAGTALGVWTEVPEDLPLQLEERWKERFYTLSYDTDHDGIKEASVQLRYQDALPELGTPRDVPGQVFDGYYYGDRLIYDPAGQPQAALPELFEQGSIALEDVWHTKHYVLRYGPDEDGDGLPDEETEVDYGGTPPALDLPKPPPRKGYEFDGYGVGGEKIYDKDGNPVGDWDLDTEEGSYELEEIWKPKEYLLYYGPDRDGDGVPDQVTTLRFGSLPPEIPLSQPLAREGCVFDGYYVGSFRLYGSDGRPAEPWTQDPEGDGKLILTEHFTPVRITVFYGPDLNGDGRPDQYFSVRYGEAMPVLELETPERKGYRFLGYFAGETCLYDADGKPVTEYCTFTTREGSFILAGKWEAKNYVLRYGPDEDGDGEPDQVLQATYGQPYPAAEVPKLMEGYVFDGYFLGEEMVYDPEGQPGDLWIWDTTADRLEMKSHALPAKEPEEEEEEEEGKGGKGSGNGNAGNGGSGDNGSGNGGNDDKGNADDGNADPDSGEEGENGSGNGEQDPGGSVSGNNAGGNSSGDSRKKKGSGGNKAANDDGGTETAGRKSESDTGDDDDITGRPLIGEEETPEEEEKEDSLPAAAVEQNAGEDTAETEDILPALSGSGEESNEKRDSGPLPMIKKAAAVGAVTVGSLGGILGIYAGMVYLLAMAEVDTICPDGRKKRLGRLTIHSEKGKAFLIRLSREMLEQCETDRICLKIPLLFALRYHKYSIVIQTRGKKQEKQIAREIIVEI